MKFFLRIDNRLTSIAFRQLEIFTRFVAFIIIASLQSHRMCRSVNGDSSESFRESWWNEGKNEVSKQWNSNVAQSVLVSRFLFFLEQNLRSSSWQRRVQSMVISKKDFAVSTLLEFYALKKYSKAIVTINITLFQSRQIAF